MSSPIRVEEAGLHTDSSKGIPLTTEANESEQKRDQELEETVPLDEDESQKYQLSRIKKKLRGKSFNCFGEDNIARLLCARVVKHTWFESFVNVLILAALVLVSLENPFIDPKRRFWRLLMVTGEAIQLAFLVELLMRLVVYGVYNNGPKSYLRNRWNQFDTLLILTSTLTFLESVIETNDSMLSSSLLQIFRATRVVRIIIRSKGTRAAFLSIMFALSSVLKLTLVCTVFYIIFAIFAVQFKRGAFYNCDFGNVDSEYQQLVSTKQDCLDYGGDWVNGDRNFDNFFEALSLLFQLSTTEGWQDIM